jgi:Zn/Cd-binding protein ZinT
MITLRLKRGNASVRTLFQSQDGPNCQQGVQSIQFTDQTVQNAAQLGLKR